MHMENYQELSEFLNLENVQGRKDGGEKNSPVTMIRAQMAGNSEIPHLEMALAPAWFRLFMDLAET